MMGDESIFIGIKDGEMQITIPGHVSVEIQEDMIKVNPSDTVVSIRNESLDELAREENEENG